MRRAPGLTARPRDEKLRRPEKPASWTKATSSGETSGPLRPDGLHHGLLHLIVKAQAVEALKFTESEHLTHHLRHAEVGEAIAAAGPERLWHGRPACSWPTRVKVSRV